MSSRLVTLALFALSAALAAIFHFLGRDANLGFHVPAFIALSLAAGIVYLIGVYLVERSELGLPALVIILGGAVVFRLLALPSSPSLSEDIYRYQWEGRVQRAHLNPYSVFPDMPGLESFQDPAHPLTAASSTPTLYPPLSEKLFACLRTVSGYKRVFATLDLASLAILLLLLAARAEPLHRSLAYAWNPVVISSFALCGHHDSLAVVLLMAANLLIIVHRSRLSIAALALASLAKFFPGFLLPIFLKRTKWTYGLVFIGLVALGYLPYIGAGPRLFRGVSTYAAGWEGNDSLFRLIRSAGNSKPQAELVAGVLVLALVAYALKQRFEPLRASFFLIGGLLLLSPNAFPWYFTWLIPFLCFYPSPPWLLMSVTAVLGYSPVVAYVEGQAYRDSPLMLTLEYVPMCLWMAYEGWHTLRSSRPLPSTSPFSDPPLSERLANGK